MRLCAALVICAVALPAAARTPHFEQPWRQRVARVQAEYERDPGAFPNLLRVVPPPSPPPSAVASANERWESDGLLLSWGCESAPESPDSWDRMWLDIIDGAWDGVHLYIYIHHDGHSDAGDVTRCQQMLQQHTGRDPSGATWFDETGDHRLDSIWIRDYGPFFVADEYDELRVVDADYVRYNRDNDDEQPAHFASWAGLPWHEWPFATEGGNFLPNGHGICLVSETIYSLNPQYSLNDIEHLYEQYLGCSELVILRGLDDVTGHVDMWITWLDATTLVVGQYTQSQDPSSHALIEEAVEQQLGGLVDPGSGQTIEIVRIPMPDNDGGWTWRNYTNGIWIDDTYLMPVYGGFESMQAEAIAVFEAHGVDVVPIDADVVISSAGALHCISKTIPAVEAIPTDDDDAADDDAADDDTVGGPGDDDMALVGDSGCQCGAASAPRAPWAVLLALGIWLLRRG